MRDTLTQQAKQFGKCKLTLKVRQVKPRDRDIRDPCTCATRYLPHLAMTPWHSRPRGGVHRRHVCALGQREGPPVCVFTVQDSPSSLAEGRSVSRCSDDSDCSSAGNSLLVPGTSGPVPRRSYPTAPRRSATADSGRHFV